MLKKFIAEIQFYRRLLADPETPKLAKWSLYIGLAYLASPIDLIPDFLPFIGQLDDLLIVGGLLWLARLCTPAPILARCRAAETDTKTSK